jgi:hypothetical protein
VTTVRPINQVTDIYCESLSSTLERKVSINLTKYLYSRLLHQVQLATEKCGLGVEGVIVQIRVVVKAGANRTD